MLTKARSPKHGQVYVTYKKISDFKKLLSHEGKLLITNPDDFCQSYRVKVQMTKAIQHWLDMHRAEYEGLKFTLWRTDYLFRPNVVHIKFEWFPN